MQIGNLIKNQFGDVFFSGVNPDSFIAHSAITQFERYIFPRMVQKDTLYIIVGTDSGLLANALEERYLNNRYGRVFIFLEHPEVLAQFSGVSFPDWLQVVDSLDQVISLITSKFLRYVSERRVIFVDSISVLDGVADSVILKEKMVERYNNYGIMRSTSLNYKIYISAILFNLAHNRVHISQFENAFSDFSAIVIAGGPTLDESIDWIRQQKGKLIVFSVARIAEKIISLGIKVDFFVSIDPTIDSFFNSRSVLKVDYPCILLNHSHVAPILLSQWQHATIYMGNQYPWQDDEYKSEFRYGNTVGHYAFVSAALMGFNRIYLAGLDFCFVENKTHALGSAENDIGKYYLEVRPKVRTFSGDTAETTVNFSNGRDGFEKQVNYFLTKKPSLEIYALSEKSAYVDGVKLLDKSLSVQSDIDQVRVRYNNLYDQCIFSVAQNANHIDYQIKSLQKVRKQLSVAKKCLSESMSLLNKIRLSPFENQRKLFILDQKIIQLVGDKFSFSSSLAHEQLEREEMFKQDMISKGVPFDKLTIEQFESYFRLRLEAFEVAFVESNKMIDLALQRLQQQNKSLQSHVPLSTLAPLWLADNEPGVVLKWLRYFPDKELSQEEHELVEKLKNAYHRILNELESEQLMRFQSQARNVVFLVEELRSVLNSNKVQDLPYLQDAFNKALTKSHDIDQLPLLFDTLLKNMLRTDIEVLQQLEELDFSVEPLQVFVIQLKLKLSLQLGVHDCIVANYQCLIAHNILYTPSFAKYWLQLDNLIEAEALLNEFTMKYPLDIASQIELMSIWQQQGKYDSVIERIGFLLEKYADNSEVLKLVSHFREGFGV